MHHRHQLQRSSYPNKPASLQSSLDSHPGGHADHQRDHDGTDHPSYVGPFLHPMAEEEAASMASVLVTRNKNGKQMFYYELPSLHVIGRRSRKPFAAAKSYDTIVTSSFDRAAAAAALRRTGNHRKAREEPRGLEMFGVPPAVKRESKLSGVARSGELTLPELYMPPNFDYSGGTGCLFSGGTSVLQSIEAAAAAGESPALKYHSLLRRQHKQHKSRTQ